MKKANNKNRIIGYDKQDCSFSSKTAALTAISSRRTECNLHE